MFAFKKGELRLAFKRLHVASRYRYSSVRKAPTGKIAVAMSGGIDSSVTAWLLKRQGYECIGVFMRNWDPSDEVGSEACTINKDLEHMQQVCERLEIPSFEVEFVKDYWNEVFIPFIDSYATGTETPNPDVLCNRYIKFGRFKETVKERFGIDHIATGHYARIGYSSASNEDDDPLMPQLLRGIDPLKDQSYFLSMTTGNSLKNVHFPIGDYKKTDIKAIAAEVFQGLDVLTKPESMGVCFIGPRSMPEFLSHYIDLSPGRFVDIDTGKQVGKHRGKEALTIGQGARVGGTPVKYFVVSNNPSADLRSRFKLGPSDVIVARGTNHPALFCDGLTVKPEAFSWVAGRLPAEVILSASGGSEGLRCHYKARYHQSPKSCTVSLRRKTSSTPSLNMNIASAAPLSKSSTGNEERRSDVDAHANTGSPAAATTNSVRPPQSMLSSASASDKIDSFLSSSSEYHDDSYDMVVKFDEPMRAVTKGQILALYDGDICLGGGPIDAPGISPPNSHES